MGLGFRQLEVGHSTLLVVLTLQGAQSATPRFWINNNVLLLPFFTLLKHCIIDSHSIILYLI